MAVQQCKVPPANGPDGANAASFRLGITGKTSRRLVTITRTIASEGRAIIARDVLYPPCIVAQKRKFEVCKVAQSMAFKPRNCLLRIVLCNMNCHDLRLRSSTEQIKLQRGNSARESLSISSAGTVRSGRGCSSAREVADACVTP